jgi:hypothetical protein
MMEAIRNANGLLKMALEAGRQEGAEWMREQAVKRILAFADAHTGNLHETLLLAVACLRALPTKEETCTPSKKGHP